MDRCDMSEYEFFTDLVKEINSEKDKYVKLFTVNNDIVRMKHQVRVLTRNGVVVGFRGRNSLCGPLCSVNMDNVTKVVLCQVV